jgi:hypothetical protein
MLCLANGKNVLCAWKHKNHPETRNFPADALIPFYY